MRWRSLHKRLNSIGIVLILFFSQVTYCQKLLVDKTKSKVNFEVTHMGMLSVNGSFNDFDGTIDLISNRVTVSGIIKSASIHTGNDDRDESIKGKAYLNVEAFREITFSATGTVSGDSINITGPMKIRGVSRPAQLKCNYTSGRQLVCVTSVKRSDFKLDFGSMDALVGDNVSVKLNLYLTFVK